ncbi:MAG: pyrimidine 5'-nucleotidase [Armatimonadota bacterium]
MRITTILFDLDCTLYPKRTGLQEEQDRRITEFIASRLGIPRGEADRLRRKYWARYGTTVQGLVEHHGLDPRDYYEHINDVDLARFLKPDAGIEAAVRRLSQRKVIFTNSPGKFAEAVLGVLRIRQHFDRIYSIEFFDHRGKPNPAAYERVLDDLGIGPAECLIVEDTFHNLLPARRLGMRTVLVGGNEDDVDACINDITELPEAVDSLDARKAAGRRVDAVEP